MKTIYHLEYEESEQTFTDMYQMYLINKSFFSYKMTVFVMGIVIMAVQISIDQSNLTSPVFYIRMLLFWVLAFALGYLLFKHVTVKLNMRNAEKIGKEQFQKRVALCGKNLKVSVDCYENHFATTFQGKVEQFTYEEVTKLYEMENLFGAVVGTLRHKKKMVGFPKVGLGEIEEEEFRRFLEEKCVHAQNGFQRL